MTIVNLPEQHARQAGKRSEGQIKKGKRARSKEKGRERGEKKEGG